MKAALRKQLRGNRRALSSSEHALHSARAATAVIRLAAFKSGARVAIYLPFDRETDTALLLRQARARGVRVYVPVVSDLRHRRLRFQRLSGATRAGTYGISVPFDSPRPAAVLAPRWFSLVVVPLVGIDAEGRRLGMGAGFYDRAFAFRRQRVHWKGPRLVALCFECQRTTSIGADPWDLRLDAVATESGLSEFSTSTSTRGTS